MEKRKERAFGKDCYLLGADENGTYYWLEQGRFCCGWYWGLGYAETYTNNKNPSMARDINSHNHFDSMFFNTDRCAYDVFKEFFVETTLSDREVWELLELMKSLYVLRDFSDLVHKGGANYTTNPCEKLLKNKFMYRVINKIYIPALLDKVYELLTPIAKNMEV